MLPLNVPPSLWFWPKRKVYLTMISPYPWVPGLHSLCFTSNVVVVAVVIVLRPFSHFSVQLAAWLFWVALRLVHILSSAHLDKAPARWHISTPGFLDPYLRIPLSLMRQECQVLETRLQESIMWAKIYIGKPLLVYFVQQLFVHAKSRPSLLDRK